MKHIKGLDGLRALAVILVLLSHWFSSHFILGKMQLGKIGVDIFFVISGFLITKILFHKKEFSQGSGKEKIKQIKLFIIRRTLRIFPIYYLLLLFLYFTNGSEFRDFIVYYLTYTSNYLFFATQNWHGFVGHFWSLAVEEQFYIFWPFLILFILKRRILALLISAIIFGTLYPYYVAENMSSILTLSCVNAFGLGALLSYVEVYKPKFGSFFYKYMSYAFIPLIILLLIQLLGYKWSYFPLRLITSLITVRMIMYCIQENQKNLFFNFLNLKFMSFVGSISYGIYLYHNFVPSYWNRVLRTYNLQFPFHSFEINYLERIVQFILLLLISYLSWEIIEKPILKLKKNF